MNDLLFLLYLADVIRDLRVLSIVVICLSCLRAVLFYILSIIDDDKVKEHNKAKFKMALWISIALTLPLVFLPSDDFIYNILEIKSYYELSHEII